MNIRNITITKKYENRRSILFFFLYTILIFIAQFFYRDVLFNASASIMKSASIGSSLSEVIGVLNVIADFLGGAKMFTIMIIFVYTTANIYKTFILIVSFSFSYYFTSVLKILYHDPLLFYAVGDDYKPYTCLGEWGNPSTNASASTCIYLVLWKIIFDCGRLRFKSKAKIISLSVIIFILIGINMLKLLAIIHSLDQILFGCTIGVQIFLFLFYVIRVDLNNGKDMIRLINIRTVYYVGILFVMSLPLILSYCLCNSSIIEEYNQILNSSKCKDVPELLRFNNNSLMFGSTYLSFLGVILGIKCEYFFTFKGNETNWRSFNFNKEESEEDSLLSRISISNETQWNHTTFFFTLMRMIVVTMIIFAIISPAIFIPVDNHMGIVLTCKFILPMTILGFFTFYITKVILRKLNLINDSVFTLGTDTL